MECSDEDSGKKSSKKKKSEKEDDYEDAEEDEELRDGKLRFAGEKMDAYNHPSTCIFIVHLA